MISNSDDLKTFLQKQLDGNNARVCAIDTEADSLHRYSESLCLLQFSDGENHVLMDPLSIEDLSSLSEYLAGATCWMHGADYDMHMLQTHLSVLPPVVYDTQIGARLLGVMKFGYADLVLHFMDVQLEKTSQKADWAKRPLTPVMEEYALNDVVYLLPMADIIVSQLKEKGRYDWFVESCEAARDKAQERTPVREDRWRIKGSGKLFPKELNYLKALWEWRDAEAESWDRPPFMVTGNRQLLEWSVSLADGMKIGLPKHFRAKRVTAFHEAASSAARVAEPDWPQKIRGQRRKKDPDFDLRLDALMKVRNVKATELGIDPSLIAARAPLEAIAGEHEGAVENLLSWQRNLLGI